MNKNLKIELDVKGDLQSKYELDLQKKGYTINSLDMKDPSKRDRFNPFVYISDQDLNRMIENILSTDNGHDGR